MKTPSQVLVMDCLPVASRRANHEGPDVAPSFETRGQKADLEARRFGEKTLLEEIAVGARCPGGARLHPGFEDYFFFDFLAFFAFFAFFAFLAMVSSSQGLMDGNATPRHARRRASLATSSAPIEQIRGALPRTVTPLSSRYPQLICIFDAILRILARRAAPRAVFHARSSAGSKSWRVRRTTPSGGRFCISSGLTMRQCAGAALRSSGTDEPLGLAIFIKSKPRRGLRGFR